MMQLFANGKFPNGFAEKILGQPEVLVAAASGAVEKADILIADGIRKAAKHILEQM